MKKTSLSILTLLALVVIGGCTPKITTTELLVPASK